MEATMRSMAVMPDKGDIYFVAVVDYGDEALNVKAKLDFNRFDPTLFLEELREKIAEGLDIKTWNVSMHNDTIIAKIGLWREHFQRMGLVE